MSRIGGALVSRIQITEVVLLYSCTVHTFYDIYLFGTHASSDHRYSASAAFVQIPGRGHLLCRGGAARTDEPSASLGDGTAPARRRKPPAACGASGPGRGEFIKREPSATLPGKKQCFPMDFHDFHIFMLLTFGSKSLSKSFDFQFKKTTKIFQKSKK